MLDALADGEDVAGRDVSMWSLTTMPRLTVRPALRPSSTLGRMPAAMTTISAGHLLAAGERDALHVPVAQQALGLARRAARARPVCSILRARYCAARRDRAACSSACP